MEGTRERYRQKKRDKEKEIEKVRGRSGKKEQTFLYVVA